MKMKMKCIASVVLCMGVASAWAQPNYFAKPLARLANGEVVGEQDLSEYLSRRIDLRQIARNAWGVEGVVQEMLFTRVLVLEGERIQLPRKAEDGRPQRFDDVYGLAVYKKQVPACELPANEEEARKYFDAHPEAFTLPVQARVERIILPVSSQIDESSAMAWLQEQARAVIQGQSKFGLVAQRAQAEYSLDAQGDLGWIALDGEHTIMRALKTVKAGELLGPVQDGEFVYLFSVLQKREARQLSWEEAKSFAANRAVSHCRQEAQTQMRAELFKRYGVDIDRAAIRELMTKANRASAAPDGIDAKPGEKADAKQ